MEKLDIDKWKGPFPASVSDSAIAALEHGKILCMPGLHFGIAPSEQRFLSPSYLNGKSKNISFYWRVGAVGGVACEGAEREQFTAMMHRFWEQSVAVISALCPLYADHLEPGLTSFRPAEIAGRASSWRKDDTRLHIDAFPSRPNQGRRILRFFANVNSSAARVWRAGEPFDRAAATLLPRVRPPLPGWLALLPVLKITKGRRTLYDHYMLGLHDAMKEDSHYQKDVAQSEIAFPPGATWACFTDAISHAAMSGQHAFEQTFYLPVSAMRNPQQSPLRVLEQRLGKRLV